MPEIVELRILPPFAIARLWSSADPMDNYELEVTDPIGHRRIQDAHTLLVDRPTGEMQSKDRPFEVRFEMQRGTSGQWHRF